MHLCLDVGNTRIKWAVHDGTAWRERGSCLTREVAGLGQPWAAWPVQRVVVSNVAGPEIAAQLILPVLNLSEETLWLQARAEGYGVIVRYARPEQLGSDRYAALIATRALGLAPCLVVLAGTAVTIDLLTAPGEFPGGLIVPGRVAMAESLASATHALTHELTHAPGRARNGSDNDWPDNTQDALEAGRLRAICGAIEAQWRRASAAGKDDLPIVLSGGDAAWLATELGAGSVLQPGTLRLVDDLVLEGLRVVAETDTPWSGG